MKTRGRYRYVPHRSRATMDRDMISVLAGYGALKEQQEYRVAARRMLKHIARFPTIAPYRKILESMSRRVWDPPPNRVQWAALNHGVRSLDMSRRSKNKCRGRRVEKNLLAEVFEGQRPEVPIVETQRAKWRRRLVELGIVKRLVSEAEMAPAPAVLRMWKPLPPCESDGCGNLRDDPDSLYCKACRDGWIDGSR